MFLGLLTKEVVVDRGIDLVHLYMQAVPGIVESSPGVRSCMIEYDQRVLPLSQLLETLESIDRELPAVSDPLHTCISVYELGVLIAWQVHEALLPDGEYPQP